MGRFILILVVISFVIKIDATVYWLSPTGSDAASGLSLATAWATPQKAFDAIGAGDTLWIKGGTYMVHATVKTKNGGTATNPICVFAVKGERPVFDCSSFRNYGSESSTYRGLDLRQPYWRLKGIKIYKAGHNGIIIAGGHIIVEGCVVQECGHDGISIGSGSVDALILNCDSYRNAEVKGKGENGDGFAAKEGVGTIFRGCRAWQNVDDGWDVYGGNQPVLVDSCWSFGNGVNYWPELITSFQGDGNGFKLGGGGGVDGNAPNVVVHSFAFNNVSKGFDQNHNSWGVTCINCTGYKNGGMGNFAFQEAPSAGQHVMINNLSYAGSGHNIAAGSREVTNSWNVGISFTDDDFESLEIEHATLDRDDDYHLTDSRILSLFKLKSHNPAIDKGTLQTYIRLKPYYAIPYCGLAPDLGAREYLSGSWVYPEPDEKEPDTEQPDQPADRPIGTKNIIVNVISQFTINVGATSSVWGPFSISRADQAIFDMQAVGSSLGSCIVEFSRDNMSWAQVGSPSKNGSTSWVNGKVVDLSSTSAPWGDAIYIRINNNSTKNVNIKNLQISAYTYDPNNIENAIASPQSDKTIVGQQFYNITGQPTSSYHRGVLLVKSIYSDGSVVVQKQINRFEQR